MWKAAVGQKITIPNQDEDDDWETDPDFVNNVTEQEQRWGSTTVQGSGRTAGAINMEQLRRETEEADVLRKKKQLEEASDNPSFGYGGKFGVEKDRMDQSAVGHEYVAKVEKHASQKDYSTGFGGKFGIQSDRIDKSAVNWDYKEKLEKHASQKDYAAGFGGKFGVQTDRQDKSAVGWDHIEKIEKHESQKDYAKGFGGKFGVQSDRIDKSAVGWDHHEAPQKHESQLDHKKGFGGKFGIQTDRFDKSAASFNNETTTPLDILNKYEAMSIEKNKNNVEKNVEKNVPKKSVHAKVALFNKTADNPLPKEKPLRTSLDSSKTAFLKQTIQSDENSKITPKALDQSKIAQFNKQNNTENKINSIENGLKTKEIESVPIKDEPITTVIEPPVQKEQIYDNLQNSDTNNETETISEDVEYYSQDEIVDTGVSAVALFDYQAAADDEISFDPDDIITHIEKIDEGWWRGLCKGMYGLFPANYVQIQE